MNKKLSYLSLIALMGAISSTAFSADCQQPSVAAQVGKCDSDASEKFKIPVYGNCEGTCTDENLIGYTSDVKKGLNKSIPLETKLGSAGLYKSYNRYTGPTHPKFTLYFDGWSQVRNRGLVYTTPDCNNANSLMLVGSKGDFYYTNSNNELLKPIVITSRQGPYNIPQGAKLRIISAYVDDSSVQYYSMHDGKCDYFGGDGYFVVADDFSPVYSDEQIKSLDYEFENIWIGDEKIGNFED